MAAKILIDPINASTRNKSTAMRRQIGANPGQEVEAARRGSGRGQCLAEPAFVGQSGGQRRRRRERRRRRRKRWLRRGARQPRAEEHQQPVGWKALASHCSGARHIPDGSSWPSVEQHRRPGHLKPEETERDFSGQRLVIGDAILLAFDLRKNSSSDSSLQKSSTLGFLFASLSILR